MPPVLQKSLNEGLHLAIVVSQTKLTISTVHHWKQLLKVQFEIIGE